MLPECSLYSEGIQNRQELHDLQKCVVLHQLQHPKPETTKYHMGTLQLDHYRTVTGRSQCWLTLGNILFANLDGLVIAAGYHTKLLIGMRECKIIYSSNMSINLERNKIHYEHQSGTK